MSSEISRRQFLKVSGALAAAAGVVSTSSAEAATPEQTRATLPYPRKVVVTATKLKVDAPQSFSYPDASSNTPPTVRVSTRWSSRHRYQRNGV